jgi:aminoglycoside phosphotransferase (APT) family kinase protein
MSRTTALVPSTEAVAAAAQAATGSWPAGVQRLPGGYGHCAWYCATTTDAAYLLKIPVRRREVSVVANQVAAARLAELGGVPVPAIEYADLSSANPIGQPFFVQRWIVGEDAACWVMRAPRRISIARFAAELGELTARMHLIELDRFAEGVTTAETRSYEGFHDLCTQRCAELAGRLRSAGMLPRRKLSQLAGTVTKRLEALGCDSAPHLVHRDLYLPNVIVGDEHVRAVIDMESAAAYDTAWEFVKLENWVFRHWPDMRAPFLASYGDVLGDDPALPERVTIAQGIEIMAGISYFGAEWPDVAMHRDFLALLDEWLTENG